MTDHFPERRFDTPSPMYFSICFYVAGFLAMVVFTILAPYWLWLMITRALRNYDAIATATVAEVELLPHRRQAVAVDPYVRERIPHIIYRTASELPYEEEKCACCQCEYMFGDSVSVIPSCRHSFHSSCFADYMSRSATCPYCRHRISLDQPLEDAADLV